MKKKKSIIIIFFIATMFSFRVQPAQALIVFDPANFGVNTGTTGWTLATSIVTALDEVNNVILKPLRDMATIASIVSNGKQINNLILGSMGTEKLLITDPEQYLKNKANISIKINLNTVAKTNGVYSNSILNSVINATKNSDINTRIATLSQSSIPATAQQKMCTEEALNRQVLSEGVTDPTVFAARKTAISNTYCKGNTNNNLALSNALIQKPDIDTFLAITQGENAYARSVKVGEVVIKEAEEKKVKSAQEITTNGGIKSEINCDKRLELADDEVGPRVPTDTIPCIGETITKSAASLKTMWDDALSAPLKTLQANLSGASSVLGSVFNTISLLGQINNSINTTATNLGGGSGGNSQTTTSAPARYSNVTYSNVASSGGTAGQTADFVTKLEIDPIISELNMNADVVKNLKVVDQNYISKINQYDAQLETASSCFNKLTKDYSIPVEPTFVSFYNDKKSATFSLLNKITEESNYLSTTTTYISSTLSAIKKAKTMSDAAPTYSAYKDQMDLMGGIPDNQVLTDRKTEYEIYSDFVTTETTTLSSGSTEFGTVQTGTTGDIPRFLGQCASIRATEEAKRFGGGA